MLLTYAQSYVTRVLTAMNTLGLHHADELKP